MRESIGGTWVFQLVIIFMLLFVAYLTLSLNYAKAFRVKNEVLNIIEREEGMTTGLNSNYGAVSLIANYLSNSGYRAMGKCPVAPGGEAWYGNTSLSANGAEKGSFVFEQVTDENKDTKYYYCVQKINNSSNYSYYRNEPNVAHYNIRLFFKFDLPFFGEITTFTVKGQTIDIQYPQDNEDLWHRTN